MREKLTVLIPTYNNESTIRDSLEVFKWADEILIVDSFSTDKTLDICREYGASIIQHEYIQSAKQKNWAIPQCKHEWVLQMDTDEFPEPGLPEEIKTVLENPPPDVNGYRITCKHHILGQWVRVAGLYPAYYRRLFRKSVGRFQDKEVHARVIIPGKIGILHHHMLHYGMTSIHQQLRNLDRYSRYQADELRKQGKKFRWYHLVLRPLAIFGYYYFWRLGFTAGYRGLLVVAHAVMFDFWSHAKLWEMQAMGWKASPK